MRRGGFHTTSSAGFRFTNGWKCATSSRIVKAGDESARFDRFTAGDQYSDACIGDKTLKEIEQRARELGVSYWETITDLLQDDRRLRHEQAPPRELPKDSLRSAARAPKHNAWRW